MAAVLELRYLRDGSRWALDAELRAAGAVAQRWGRHYLEAPGTSALAAAVAAFAAAYELALVAGDEAGDHLTSAPGVIRALREQVRPAAQQLGALLLPPPLHACLGQSPAPRIEIVCDGDLQHVPFEAAWWRDDFLGFRFAVSRRLVVRHQGHRPRPRVDTPPRCALVADPGNQLNRQGQSHAGSFVQAVLGELRDGWQDHAVRQLGLPPTSCRLGETVSKAEVATLMATHDVFVLLAHHEADRRSAGTAEVSGPGRGAQLGADTYFSGADLLDALAGDVRLPWLLCWPCCQSGTGETWRRTWREDEPAHSLPGLAAAAQRLGVPQFIGTTFEVHASFVAPLLGPLLEALDQGHGSAEALRRARVALRRDRPADPFHAGTLPGLAFLLLGDGGGALLSAAGARLDYDHPAPPDLRWCAETGSPGVCGRAVAPGEPGHPHHRCHQHVRIEPTETLCSAGHRTRPDELRRCDHPGCGQTYCPHCRTHRFARCWRHAGARGPLRHETEGTPCADPHGLHPTEPRTVGYDEPGFTRALCPDCWAEHKRRITAALNPR